MAIKKAIFQIGSKKFLLLKKLNTLCCGHILFPILNEKTFLERLTTKNCKKYIQNEVRVEKAIKRKGDKIYVKWKAYDSSLTVGLIKKTQYK